MKLCKICGEKFGEHHDHDWIEIPEGCVCDWREWNYEDRNALPPVCTEYNDRGFGGTCGNCEHDKACHQVTSPLKTINNP
jgi:hypothetical protein